MQPFKKCRSAWNILDRYYEHAPAPSNHVIGNDVMTWQNLQLLRGEQEENHSCYVANLVDRTSTELGRVTQRTWIAQPTDNIDILRARQDKVRFLIEHPDVFDELDKQLKEFKKSEDFLLSFWVNDPLKHSADRFYFKLSRLQSAADSINENETLMMGATVLDHKKRFISCATIALASAVLSIYGITRLVSDPVKSELDTLSKRFIGSGLDELAKRFIGSGGPIFGWLSFIKNRYVQAGVFITAGVYCGLHAQDEFDWMHDNFTLNMYLQKKLQHVARCLQAVEEMGNLTQDMPQLKLTAHENIHDLFEKLRTENNNTQKLLNLLQENTFTGDEASIASHYGKILVAYRLMHANTAQLEEILCAVGELDAYMSIARLYKEFEHERVHYTFVTYETNTEKPTIVLKELWNPFIDPAYVVPNSTALGTHESNRNLIITGPNEGGKSTFVKSVAIGLILAQSIGIIPATAATITPFSYIATYLNITDDHGKSLFEAQVQRAKHILDHIDGMQKNKFSFVIIDELFNGTDARVGQVTSYSIADYLSKKENVISIFPTHFPLLTKLEAAGFSINCKVTATIDQHGEISYPFTIHDGISEQNIVLDILRNQGFNARIIDQATELLEQNRS